MVLSCPREAAVAYSGKFFGASAYTYRYAVKEISTATKEGIAMPDLQQLDKTFHFIMTTFVETGHAPHYTDIAREFGVSPEGGKTLLHELMGTGMAMWLHPGTDLIASFAPFNNLPTHYRLTVDGQQKWFAQ